MAADNVVPNGLFLGCEWAHYRERYEAATKTIHGKFPVHFLAPGRPEVETAEDLYRSIKMTIASSTGAVFDVSGGNVNVSLEYGYSDALFSHEGWPRPPYGFVHAIAAAARSKGGVGPIISDLSGVKRVQYDSELALQGGSARHTTGSR